MKAIGGYFELELRRGRDLHPDALRVNSGRHAFEYVLRARGYRKVWLPFYTCAVMTQPLKRLGIPWEFYSVDEQLEPVSLPELKEDEAFVYTNYFGLKQNAMERLAAHYGERLVADNAQAFYAPHLPGVDTLYSPRKFFGVPDGGYVYADKALTEPLEQDSSCDRMRHLLMRIDSSPEDGYAVCKANNATLRDAPLLRMSRLTEALLSSIDYEEAAARRRENYALLDKALAPTNALKLPLAADAVPLVYPYLPAPADAGLRQRLIGQRVFVASYWPNVLEWAVPDSWEHELASRMLPLPVDQRYGSQDMERVLQIIFTEAERTTPSVCTGQSN